MAKRQNFVVGSTNPNTNTWTSSELNNGWDRYQVLKSGDLDGVFNAVSDYSNDSSQEIANAIQALTGAQPTGGSQNELAGALQQMREDIETSSLTFKGYVATSAPSSSTYGLVEGNIWINDSAMPTTFPVAIAGVWNGTSWESTTDTYTVKDFDFFRDINDGEGYYWFGGQWTVMSTDLDTTYFTLNQNTGKWEIKSSVELPGTPTVEAEPDINDTSKKVATTAWARNLAAPVGTIVAFGGSTAPTGWLICDGSAISRTTYAGLFAVIGTAYGTGDGSTTFNLPNGKIPLGSTAPVAISGNNNSTFQSLLVKRASDNKTHVIWYQSPYGVYAANNIESDGATYTSGSYTYTFNSLYADLINATAASNAIIKY